MQLEVQGMDEHMQQVCDVSAHQHLYMSKTTATYVGVL